MKPAIRPASPLHHGGRLLEAMRRFPGAPRPFLDLSTGINPVPYPLGDLGPALFTRLPEPEAEASLLHAAAAAYGAASPDLVAAAPGTQILISLLPHLFPQAEVAILGPTYAEHGAAWRAAGAAVIEVATLEQLGGAPCAVVCNPNNPDGRRTAPAVLLALADRLAASGGVLVVDEAFADFTPELSVVPHLPHTGLLVLRSFGKAYGLAGLRLGFALAAHAIVARIRAALGPWAVSGPAIAIGTRALHDRDWSARTARRLGDDAAALDRCLERAGLRVIGGTTLFRLADSQLAPALFDRLGAAGVLVRAFPGQPDRLRFGLPAQPADWDRLRAALAAD